MSIRGRELEKAIARASTDVYVGFGRGGVDRQYPPFATGGDGYIKFTGSASIDFYGCTAPDGRFLAIEAKETDLLSFPVEKLRIEQRARMAKWHRLGARVLLVVDFTRRGEVYSVDWVYVAEFLAAPWKSSLSLEWFRAYGLLLPEQNRGRAKRRTLFLDGKEHWGRAQAREAIDKERASSPVISLAEDGQMMLTPPPPLPGVSMQSLSVEEYKERALRALNDGIGRQLRNASRRGRWRGGRK